MKPACVAVVAACLFPCFPVDSAIAYPYSKSELGVGALINSAEKSGHRFGNGRDFAAARRNSQKVMGDATAKLAVCRQELPKLRAAVAAGAADPSAGMATVAFADEVYRLKNYHGSS